MVQITVNYGDAIPPLTADGLPVAVQIELDIIDIMNRMRELVDRPYTGDRHMRDAAPRWDEAKYRRDANGKFTSFASAETKGHTANYKSILGKRKGSATALARHLLQQGVSKSDALEEVLEHYAQVKHHARLVQRLSTVQRRQVGAKLKEIDDAREAEAKAKVDAETKAREAAEAEAVRVRAETAAAVAGEAARQAEIRSKAAARAAAGAGAEPALPTGVGNMKPVRDHITESGITYQEALKRVGNFEQNQMYGSPERVWALSMKSWLEQQEAAAPPDKSRVPASLGKALDGKTPSERVETRKGLRHADSRMHAVIANLKPLSSVEYSDTGRASYSPELHRVVASRTGETERDNTIWCHEYGHAIDYNGGPRPGRSFAADGDREEESQALQAKFKPGYALGDPDYVLKGQADIDLAPHGITSADLIAFHGGKNDLITAINAAETAKLILGKATAMQSLLDAHRAHRGDANGYENVCYADFLGSMTENKIGWGHQAEYYTARPAGKCAEMFANYVALTNSDAGKVYRAIFHSVAPKTCARLEGILDDTAYPKRLP